MKIGFATPAQVTETDRLTGTELQRDGSMINQGGLPVKVFEPVEGWKVRAGCAAGWVLLGVAMALIVFGVVHDERVDFVPDETSDDLFITAAEAKAKVDDGMATILDARGGFGDHVPGAQSARWQDFSLGGSEATKSVLRPRGDLEALLTARGVRNDRMVIVYGDWANEWGEEGRLLWMLDYLGHTDVRVL